MRELPAASACEWKFGEVRWPLNWLAERQIAVRKTGMEFAHPDSRHRTEYVARNADRRF
jgi:hypothetical protein